MKFAPKYLPFCHLSATQYEEPASIVTLYNLLPNSLLHRTVVFWRQLTVERFVELERKKRAKWVCLGMFNKLFEGDAEALSKIKWQWEYSRMTMTCSSLEAFVKIGDSSDTSHEYSAVPSKSRFLSVTSFWFDFANCSIIAMEKKKKKNTLKYQIANHRQILHRFRLRQLKSFDTEAGGHLCIRRLYCRSSTTWPYITSRVQRCVCSREQHSNPSRHIS